MQLHDADTQEPLPDISDIRLIDLPALLLFWLLFSVVLLQFLTRYLLNDSIGWTEEGARYLLILVCFVGGVSCVRRNSHIYLEFFYRMIPDAAIKPLLLFVAALNTLFMGYCGWISLELIERTAYLRMVSIDLPKSALYWVVGVALMVSALVSLYRCRQLLCAPAASLARQAREAVPAG